MLIAICFFGRIAHYEKKYLIESLDSNISYDIFYSSDNELNNLIDDFIKIYNPISINNDKLIYDVDYSIYPNSLTNTVNLANMTSHFLNKKRVFGLLETHCNLTGKKYNLIISCRLDLKMDKITLPIPRINTIYIPENEDHTGINDRFAIGDFETMKKYMNVYDNSLYLLDNKVCVAHPENLTLYNIKFHNINIERINLNQQIIR